MGMRQSVGGRRSIVLYLAVVGVLLLAVALAAIVFIVAPERERRQQAEARQAQATATAEARLAEIERAYQAGIAFAQAGDWDKAVEDFTKVVAVQPGYKDVAERLAEARNSSLESAYQRGLGFFNAKRWEQAKVEFERVIAVDPNYKDIQARLAEVEAQLAVLTLTATSSPRATVTPTATTRPTDTPTATPLTELVEVRAVRDWQDTGIYVQEGDTVVITYMSGQWSPCAASGCPYVDADGDKLPSENYGDNVIMGCKHAALIGRVSVAEPFCARTNFVGQMEQPGNLQLRINDRKPNDNDGSIMVQVQTRQ